MPPLAHHLMLRLRDDRVIAATTAARRTLAGVVLGVGRELGLLAFSGADTHVHRLAACGMGAPLLRPARSRSRRPATAVPRPPPAQVSSSGSRPRPRTWASIADRIRSAWRMASRASSAPSALYSE